MAEKNVKINVKADSGYDTLYPLSKAENISFNKNNSDLKSTNIKDAIEELDEDFLLTFNLSDTVQPTSEGNALVESIEGDTWQGENPSPEYPQHIYGIGDTGYFDGELQQGFWDLSTGQYTQYANYVCNKNLIPCSESDNVKIELEDTDVAYLGIVFYGDGGEFISGFSGGETSAPTGAKSFGFRYSKQGITPQTAGHISVTINGKYAVKVNTMSANLFDASKIQTKTAGGATVTNNGDGSFTVSGSGSLSGKFSTLYKYSHAESVRLVKKVGNIIMGFEKTTHPYAYMLFYTSSGYVGEVDNVQSGTKTFSVTNEMLEDENFIIHIGFNGNQGTAISGGTIKPIVYQDGDGTFVPFQDETAYPPLSSPLYKGDQIVKIGSEYKVRRENGVAVFDGSENEEWKLYSMGTQGGFSFYTEFVNSRVGYYQTSLCDKFKNIQKAWESSEYGVYSDHPELQSKYFRQPNEEVQTLEQWKTWLQSNPITVVYKLATPVYEDIDQDQFYSIMAADELTNVSLLGENENLVPINVIRFPRNEDGALSTTAFANSNKNKKLINEVEFNIGDLSSLKTDSNETLVEAINEVNSHADTAQSTANANKTNIGTLSSLKTAVKTNIVNAINSLYDNTIGKTLKTLDEIKLATQNGYYADALAIKELYEQSFKCEWYEFNSGEGVWRPSANGTTRTINQPITNFKMIGFLVINAGADGKSHRIVQWYPTEWLTGIISGTGAATKQFVFNFSRTTDKRVWVRLVQNSYNSFTFVRTSSDTENYNLVIWGLK